MLNNLRDEGIIPNNIEPMHMNIISKTLPKRIFEDCIKEEKEIVESAGKYASKSCMNLTMKLVKEILNL